jgi:Lrp/AsnC family transcriptional regulator for asnA, asnC and gidA
MSLRLDSLDTGIIKLLQENARIMYKDMADKMGVSLPTVRTRIRRLTDLGVIKKFTVIVDPEKTAGRVRAVFLFEADPTSVDEICKKLLSMLEVRELYTTTGSYNIVAKVEVDGVHELGEFATRKFLELKGILGISSLVITGTRKEEYGSQVDTGLTLQFKCDFCQAMIAGTPVIEWIGGGRYYFTGKECAKAFKQRFEKSKQGGAGLTA